MKPQHTNPASPNENGDVEQSHHRFKRALEHALLLRGSRELADLTEYSQFLKDLFVQRNAGPVHQRVLAGQPMPARSRRMRLCATCWMGRWR